MHVNAKAELVTLAPGLRPERRFAPLARGLSVLITRNTCMQQPLALIGIQGTIFSEHEVFRVYDFEIVFIFTLSIFFKKCENNESIISFNYKIRNLHKCFS